MFEYGRDNVAADIVRKVTENREIERFGASAREYKMIVVVRADKRFERCARIVYLYRAI